MKLPTEGITRIHVRFKGGRTETLTAANPKSSAQMVKTAPEVVAAIDELLDEHIYEEIAELLNARGFARVVLPDRDAQTGASAPNVFSTSCTPTDFALATTGSANEECSR